MIQQLSAVGRSSLELLCQLRIAPSLIVTNDWFAGLVSVYAKYGRYGAFFNQTKFFHIFHNLGEDYEGRIYFHEQDVYNNSLNKFSIITKIFINFLSKP